MFVEKYDVSKFDRPSVTVDNIAWAEYNNKKWILLIRRAGHPYKGYWALPGGFLDVKSDKNLEEAALRELREETGLSKDLLIGETKQFRTYSDIGTDPRTRIIDVVFSSKFTCEALTDAKAGDDAAETHVFSLDNLPKLGFNHAQIIREYFESIENQ